MDELDNLLTKLGIESHLDLLGQSWGGMLAADYVPTRHPKGLRRLIIANAAASEALWEESMLQHLSKFSQALQDLVRKHKREGTTSSKEYQDALRVFYNKHTCQVMPRPEELVMSFKAMEGDPTVYTTMCVTEMFVMDILRLTEPRAWTRLGTSEFNRTGTLKIWSVIDRLHTITCPTFIVNVTAKGAQDFVVAPFVERIPKVKWVEFAKSHCPFWEDKEYYFMA